MGFSSESVAAFIAVLGILSIIAQVSYTLCCFSNFERAQRCGELPPRGGSRNVTRLFCACFSKSLRTDQHSYFNFNGKPACQPGFGSLISKVCCVGETKSFVHRRRADCLYYLLNDCWFFGRGSWTLGKYCFWRILLGFSKLIYLFACI